MNYGIFLFLFLSFFALPAFAHQPRLVFDQINSGKSPFIVSNPDISQIFYGEFKSGRLEYYKVNLSSETDFYLGVLVPDNAALRQRGAFFNFIWIMVE